MKKRILSFAVLCGLMIQSMVMSCSEAPQVSGVEGELQFDTRACEPETQFTSIRNPFLDSSQRIMGVLLEPGLEDNKYFKINSVKVNGVDKTVEANQASEVLVPAGGVVTVEITYNPTVQTDYGKLHHGVLSVVLNGPELGVVQVDLYGNAPVSKPGCGQGKRYTFKVDQVRFNIVDSDQGDIPEQILTDFVNGKDKLSFVVDSEGVATIDAEDFPVIEIDVPNQADPLPATLDKQSAPFTGTFNEAEGTLEFDDFVINAAGVINVPGLLTTGLSFYSANDGDIEAQGMPLSNGKMNLGFTGPLPNDIDQLGPLNGGAIGAVFEMTQIQ